MHDEKSKIKSKEKRAGDSALFLQLFDHNLHRIISAVVTFSFGSFICFYCKEIALPGLQVVYGRAGIFRKSEPLPGIAWFVFAVDKITCRAVSAVPGKRGTS